MSERRERFAPLAAFIMAAAITLAVRWAGIGDIVAHGDEQFYLLVGDHVLNRGAVPYADIWDRKPVGLFLLYAGIRLLAGEGIVQYQLVALMAVAATSGIMALWVARQAGWIGAVVAVMLYNGLLVGHLGFGGQAEVFLNLLVVMAGWLVHRTILGGQRFRAILVAGGAAMLLVGLAIQIKPTAVLPGGFLGPALIWAAWRSGLSWERIAGLAAIWGALALLPTLLVVMSYWAMGLFDQWLFANVLSIFEKAPDRAAAIAGRMDDMRRAFGRPFALAGLVAVGQSLFRRDRQLWLSILFLLGWLVSGVAAVAVLSAAYPHYALVMAPMGCLLAGYAVRGNLPGYALALWLLNLSLDNIGLYERRLRASAPVAIQLRAMARAIRPYLGHRECLYVYHGPVVLYRLTDACVPTRFAFPNHLSIRTEANGLGVDPVVEVKRILAERPAVIVDGAFDFHQPNRATRRLVHATLARDYRPIAKLWDTHGRPLATAHARSGTRGSR